MTRRLPDTSKDEIGEHSSRVDDSSGGLAGIEDVNEVVVSIATAVEEKATANEEIAGHINQASLGRALSIEMLRAFARGFAGEGCQNKKRHFG